MASRRDLRNVSQDVLSMERQVSKLQVCILNRSIGKRVYSFMESPPSLLESRNNISNESTLFLHKLWYLSIVFDQTWTPSGLIAMNLQIEISYVSPFLLHKIHVCSVDILACFP